MYYVYRYIDKNEIIYIGITNNLYIRYKQHKKDKWFNDKLKYQFIEVKNKYLAKVYEEYLINRDNPKSNIAEKNNYDVSDIKFNIKEMWKAVNLENKKQKSNKMSDKKLSIDEKIQFINDVFYELIKQSLNKILKIYYDEYGYLTCILEYTEYMDKIANGEYLPSSIHKIQYNKERNYIFFGFKEEQFLCEEDQEVYHKIHSILNIDKLQLDKKYGENLRDDLTLQLEEKYIGLVKNDYLISIIDIKYNIQHNISINILFKLFGGLLYVSRLSFAILLKYRREELLVYYGEVNYSVIINRIKEKYEYQYYLKDRENYRILDFMLYKEKIINIINGDCEEIIRRYYLDICSILQVDISNYIINSIRD